MANLGSPVITSGPNGLMLLAHRTKSGLQTSIENFDGLQEARAFLARHKMRASFELEAGKLSGRELDLIVAVGEGAEMVGTIAGVIKSTPAWICKTAAILAKDGLVWVEPGEKRKRDVVGLTATGMLLGKRLKGSVR